MSALTQSQYEIQALDFRLRELGMFIERALQTEKTTDFFYNLCDCICPILFSIPLLEPLRKSWISEKEKFENKCHNLETQAIAEIRTVFNDLTQISLPNDGLRSLLKDIEKVLTGQEPYFSPSYFEVVYDKICAFCQACLDANQGELISSLVEIEEGESGKRISRFLFAPHVLKLRSFKEEVLNWKTPCNWVIWEHMYAAYWAWKTDFSFFSRKKLSSVNAVKCQHSMQRLEQLNLWQEMQWIRKKSATQSRHKLLFFTVERFAGYLKRLTDQILKFQAETKPDKPNDTICPYSLELVLHPYELHLVVEWMQGELKTLMF